MKRERNILQKNCMDVSDSTVYTTILHKIQGNTLAHMVREVSIHEDDEVPSRMLYPMNVGSS